MSVSRRAGPPHFGQLRVHEFRHARQRRLPLPCERHILRQPHRQLIVRHRHDAVLLAVNHRNRRAPVALPRNAPVLQPVRSFRRADLLGFGVRRHFLKGLLGRKTGVRPGIHQPPVFGERLAHPVGDEAASRYRLDHDFHRQVVLLGKFEVALVVRRHGHHRAGAVFRQDEIRHPDRNLRAGKWIHRKAPGERIPLFRRWRCPQPCVLRCFMAFSRSSMRRDPGRPPAIPAAPDAQRKAGWRRRRKSCRCAW